MAKPKKPAPRKIDKDDEKLLEEVQAHQSDSETWLETLRDGWDEKESMLIVKHEDAISKKMSSKIYDPRLSTIVFERAARVMARNLKGKAFAVSQDDIGKNMGMNLMLGHYRDKANEGFSHLIKLRLWDLYSLIYGTKFMLVPWRINERSGYIGPETKILAIRDCFPQPGIRNVNEADWFTARNVVSIDWLKQQDPDTWDMESIERLAEWMEANRDEGDTQGSADDERKSYVEKEYYPSSSGDIVYPRVETYTEYRGDMWITWTPRKQDSETSRPYILRKITDGYPEGILPVVAKHAFPLLDSPIGLGEFERGKSLQFGLNSLINLYMQGVKASIFPPLAINVDEVTPSSIKWGEGGERWFMDRPGQSVQPVDLSPQGLQTFQSTYGFMLSALYNQAGTSEVTPSEERAAGSLGKTPEAIRFTAARESARDEWDRFMMEEALKEVYERWIALTVDKMEVDQTIRLFEDEIKDIQKDHKDIVELFKSKKRGQVKINKKMIDDQYDFKIESGSTMRPNIENEQENITAVLRAVVENPAILERLEREGKTVNFTYLFTQWVEAGRAIKDSDKIIIPIEPVKPEANVIPEGEVATPEANVPPTEVQTKPNGEQQIQLRDPEIAQLAQEVLGGVTGIPPVK